MSQKIKQLKTGHKCLDLSNKMKKTLFTESQIAGGLKEGEEGRCLILIALTPGMIRS